MMEPIRLDHFMTKALYDPQTGYYHNKQPIGREGDYTTAPEMTQVFGEVVGAWILDIQKKSLKDVIRIVEFGPGFGTWMADILRTIKKLDKEKIVEVYLFEVSPFFKRTQQKKISSAVYVNSLTELPPPDSNTLTFFVSNEFFDSLPIRQFRWKEGQLYETYIEENNSYEFLYVPISSEKSFPIPQPEDTNTCFYEISPLALEITEGCATYINNYPSAFLAIDYGYDNHLLSLKGTLEAIHKHTRCHPLSMLGEADLSSHVNFGALKDIFSKKGLPTYLTEQRNFLKKLGFEERTAILAHSSPGRATTLLAAAHRLLASSQMGKTFKALASHSLQIDCMEGF